MLNEKTRNGYSYPILRFNGQDYDLSQLNRDDLQELRNRIEDALDQITISINQAKVNRLTTGEYADPQWFMRVNLVKKRFGRMVQIVQQEMGKRPKERKTLPHLSSYFMDVARTLLKPDTFEMLYQEALAKQEADKDHAH